MPRMHQFALVSVATVASLWVGTLLALPAFAQDAHVHYINGPRKDAPIPRPGMTLVKGQFAVVVTDPQNDFLNPKGVAWSVVGQSVTTCRRIPERRATAAAKHEGALQGWIALARLRRWCPALSVWGLSATLGHLDEAMHALVACADGLLVRGRIDKSLRIDTVLPPAAGRDQEPDAATAPAKPGTGSAPARFSKIPSTKSKPESKAASR